MKIVFTIVACLVALGAASSYILSRPAVTGVSEASAAQSLQVAPFDRALTLARHRSGSVLLVKEVNKEGVSAIDVGVAVGEEFEDTLQVYEKLGMRGLQALYDSSGTTFVSWDELGVPLGEHYPHVAAGTNYRAHAKEVGHEGEPFLFPKLSHATAWDSDVQAGARLDYEVELCAVPLNDHLASGPAALGYVLCGDFTDRWLLVKHIKLDGEMGLTGFAIAKGGESRLPIGPLLVIPHSETFYRELELGLYVNGTLRQSAQARSMIWSPQQILSRALADCHTSYQVLSETTQIGGCERIPAGTLILTGTPEGVLFHLATLWNPWVYLRIGDVVTSFGTYLGHMRNTIVAG